VESNTGKGARCKLSSIKFSICVIDPVGYKFTHFLYDTIRYLCYSLEDAGYDCCINRNLLMNDRINIIVGLHLINDMSVVDQIIRYRNYIVLQTELVTDKVFQGAVSQEHLREVQLPVLRNARAVWTGIESSVAHLRELGVNARFILYGYNERMEEIRHKRHKDIDFLFFGSITRHRARMLGELKQKGGNVVTIFDDPYLYRNDLIARTRVNLSLNQGPDMVQFSGSRVIYLLNNRCIVVAERSAGQERFEKCFFHAPEDEWADLCLETVRRSDLDKVAEEFYEEFRKVRMSDYIKELLESSNL